MHQYTHQFKPPAFMLVVYTFVFSVIFKARWHAGTESKTEFALVLFAGLLVFNFFAECVNRAPGLILHNANYVKKVVFPLGRQPYLQDGYGRKNVDHLLDSSVPNVTLATFSKAARAVGRELHISLV